MIVPFFLGLGFLAGAIFALLLWPRAVGVSGRRAFFLLAVFLGAAALLYALAGNPRLLAEQFRREAAHDAAETRIAARVSAAAANPDAPEAWMKLGEAYLEAGRPGLAMGAFERAVLLGNGAPQALLAYGRAQVLAAGGQVTARAAETFRMALLQTEDAQARLFLAMRDATTGKRTQAVQALTRLIDRADTPSAVREAAREQRDQILKNEIQGNGASDGT